MTVMCAWTWHAHLNIILPEIYQQEELVNYLKMKVWDPFGQFMSLYYSIAFHYRKSLFLQNGIRVHE